MSIWFHEKLHVWFVKSVSHSNIKIMKHILLYYLHILWISWRNKKTHNFSLFPAHVRMRIYFAFRRTFPWFRAGHVIRIKAMDTTLGKDYAAVERLRSRVCTDVRVLYGGFCSGHQLVGATAQQKQARPRCFAQSRGTRVQSKGARRFLPSLYTRTPFYPNFLNR